MLHEIQSLNERADFLTTFRVVFSLFKKHFIECIFRDNMLICFAPDFTICRLTNKMYSTNENHLNVDADCRETTFLKLKQ